jgi:dCTP deaminase
MVLNDTDLHRLGPSLVDPFDPGMVQPASIDLRLGDEFIVFDRDETIAIDLDDVPADFGRKVRVAAGERDWFVLHPGEFCLAVTRERVAIPGDMVARVEGRSSVGRLGLAIHVTAGYIDPGFRGPITLEMANLSPHPMILRPGKSICQLSVMMLTHRAKQPYDGRYQDSDGVVASRL